MCVAQGRLPTTATSDEADCRNDHRRVSPGECEDVLADGEFVGEEFAVDDGVFRHREANGSVLFLQYGFDKRYKAGYTGAS